MSTDGSKFRNSDLPAVEDRLGTEKQRDGLVRFMRECSTPMTIAVQGDWGTGKTSMMQLLQKQLEGENGCTLWFPTWQFAVLGEQDRLLMDLLMLLCCELKKSCSEMTEKEQLTFKKVFRFIRRVGRAATIGGLYLAAEAGKKLTNIDIPNALGETVDELKNLDEEENEEESIINYTSFVMQVSELHNNLTSLIDAYLNANGTERLYIFIDDLDRLEPVRAVELLEGIKNFLDIPRCVFMIAIDTKVVMEGLRKKYGDNMDAKKQEHFFDKIIQIPYKLPLHRYKLRLYMKEVLKGYDEANVDEYVEFLEKADIRNPRTIKRCVNFCLLHKCMDKESVICARDKNICLHRFAVKMLELEQEKLYWELFNAIIKNDNYATLKETLEKYKTKADTSDPKSLILSSVMEHFGIDDVEKSLYSISILSNLILGFANNPFYNKLLTHSIVYATMFTDIAYRNDSRISILEEAQELHNKKHLKCDICSYGTDWTVECYDHYIKGTASPLKITIYCSLPPKKLFNGVEYRSKMTFSDRGDCKGRELICVKFLLGYKIYNILDTSSPDAPIYRVLRNAGIIT